MTWGWDLDHQSYSGGGVWILRVCALTLIYRAPCYIYTVANQGEKKTHQPNLNKKKIKS